MKKHESWKEIAFELKHRADLFFTFISVLFGCVCLLVLLGYLMEDGTIDGAGCYISTPEELVDFANRVNGGEPFNGVHVILTDDLDMSDVLDFKPIGIYDSGYYFYGVFDGQGHTISNLQITCEEGGANNGLFGALAGTVCNLTLEKPYVTGAASGAFASISLCAKGKIVNCQVRDANVQADYTSIFTGQFVGKIENCALDNAIVFGVHEEQAQEKAEKAGAVGRYASAANCAAYFNDLLEEASTEAHGLPMCRWSGQDGRLAMEQEDAENFVRAPQVWLQLSRHDVSEVIQPFYQDKAFCFVIPETDGKIDLYVEELGSMQLMLPEDATDETFFVEKTKAGGFRLSEKCEDAGQKICRVRFLQAKDTASVFLRSEAVWSTDYLRPNKDNKLYGGNILVLNEKGAPDYEGPLLKVSGRGNDSFNVPKQSFAFELKKKGNLLQMGESKKFALLSGYRDQSLLTYKVDQDLYREIGFHFAPRYEFVNYYQDGEYMGLYLLAEKINLGPNRIEVAPSGTDVTGNYLYEMAEFDHDNEPYLLTTERENIYVISEPSEVSREQQEYSLKLWNDFEDALYSEDGKNAEGKHFTEYMDLDSLAKVYLFFEMSGEYSVNNSVYFYKEADRFGDGKLHAIYPWDVEHGYVQPEYLQARGMSEINVTESHGFWPAFYQHLEAQREVRTEWFVNFRPALLKLLDEKTGYHKDGLSYLHSYGERYGAASHCNEVRWGEDQSLIRKGYAIEEWLKVQYSYLDDVLK